MISQVMEAFHTCFGLRSDSPILAGVSGGPDSMCLLDILVHAGCRPLVAHLDHGLRPSSHDNAEFVRLQCERYGLEFIRDRQGVREYAQQHNLTLEEAARTVRYRFLFAAAERSASRAVLVAHNADDQAETILLHIIRGSSLAGLRGMRTCSLPNPWSQHIPLLRPLLGISRADIMAYIRERQVPYLIDESNRDERFTRNRIRHSLIPMLESFNPNVKSTLQRMGALLAGDLEIIQSVIEGVWGTVLIRSGDEFVGLSQDELGRISRPLQRHVIFNALSQILADTGEIDFALIERACDFISSPPASAQAELGAGLWMYMEPGVIWIAQEGARLPMDEWPQLSGKGIHELSLPGELQLTNGWLLRAELADAGQARSQAAENRDPYTAWFDLDSLDSPLHVRARRQGDRVNPFGMGGAGMKLSDYMINQKIPRRAREAWLLITSGDQIVWVCGFTIGHGFQITTQTNRAVRLELQRTA